MMGPNDALEQTQDVQWFQLSNKMYNKLKFLVQVLLPAISVFYITLANIWSFPNPEPVALTIAAITTFLGTILMISTKSYNTTSLKYNGNLVVTVSPEGKKLYSLELNDAIEELDKKDVAAFKIIVN